MQVEGNEFAPTRSEQIAWAAGLFEGEGCLSSKVYETGKVLIQARLATTDGDVVRRFAEIVGVGSVRDGIVYRPGNKPITEWYVQNRAGVRSVIALIYPYLGDRRRAKADELLSYGEAHPKNERTHCPKGHPYAGENLLLEPIRGGKYLARRCKICRTEQSRERARRRLGITPDRYRK